MEKQGNWKMLFLYHALSSYFIASDITNYVFVYILL
jgi:hypothetical protein